MGLPLYFEGQAKGSVKNSRELSDVFLWRAVRQLDCVEVDHRHGEGFIGGMVRRPAILGPPEEVTGADLVSRRIYVVLGDLLIIA